MVAQAVAQKLEESNVETKKPEDDQVRKYLISLMEGKSNDNNNNKSNASSVESTNHVTLKSILKNAKRA